MCLALILKAEGFEVLRMVVFRVDVEALLAIVDCFCFSVEPIPFDPSEVLVQFLAVIKLFSFKVVFLCFEVLSVVVVSISQTYDYLETRFLCTL